MPPSMANYPTPPPQKKSVCQMTKIKNFKVGLGCFAMITLFSRGSRGKFNYGKLTRLTSFKGNSVCIKNSETEVKPNFKKIKNDVN